MFYAVARTSGTNERTKQGLERQAQLQPQVPQRRPANLLTQTAQAHTHHLVSLSANHDLLLTLAHRLARSACPSFQTRFTTREARGLLPPGLPPSSKQHQGRLISCSRTAEGECPVGTCLPPHMLILPYCCHQAIPQSQRRLSSSVSHFFKCRTCTCSHLCALDMQDMRKVRHDRVV